MTGACVSILVGHEVACFHSLSELLDKESPLNSRRVLLCVSWGTHTKYPKAMFARARRSRSIGATREMHGRFHVGRRRAVEAYRMSTSDFLRDVRLFFYVFQGEISKVCFNPQGTKLITASSDKTCHIWSTETGECLQVCMIVIAMHPSGFPFSISLSV